MPVTDTQLEIIFRYFDGELTDAEEQQLMQQLLQDRDLQQAFDQQVMMHQFVLNQQAMQADNAIYESADAFLNRVSGSLESRKADTPLIPIAKTSFRWRTVAATVFACLLAVSLYYYFQHKHSNNQLVKTPAKDSLAEVKEANHQNDSLVQINPSRQQPDSSATLQAAPSLQQLYADNYTLFKNGGLDVPVAAQTYQDLYEQRQYTKLATQDEKDLEVKGQNDMEEAQQTVACFSFYKALAFLQLHQPDSVIRLLLPLQGNTKNNQFEFLSQWYLLMAYLQQNNKTNAMKLAVVIAAEKRNPYNRKAVAIQQKLSLTKKSNGVISKKDSMRNATKKKNGFRYF